MTQQDSEMDGEQHNNQTGASYLQETTDPEPEDTDTSRRGFLGVLAATGMGLAGLIGYTTGKAEAATPSGDVGTEANPYEIAYVDRIAFNERTSDPSSPADGTLWYNSSA